MRVDVITAVHGARAGHVAAAWRSLRAQTHRDWRWHVQVDGPYDRDVRAALADCGATRDPRVRIAAHRTPSGPAVSRNIALGRSDAPLVQNLDGDDELEPHALALLTRALTGPAGHGYAAGHARDLLPNGELRTHKLPLTSGPLPRGVLLEAWSTEPGKYRLPLHPAGVMWRRGLLTQLGGWSAMEGMEDTGTLMAASAAATGVLIDAPTLRYRKHPGQSSSSGRKSNFSGGEVQISLIRRRATGLLTQPVWTEPLPPHV